MTKELNKLLRQYHLHRDLVQVRRDELTEFTDGARKHLNYANQTKEYKEANREYEPPLTMISPSEIRKKYTEECRRAKKNLQNEQSAFQKAEIELLAYLKEHGYEELNI